MKKLVLVGILAALPSFHVSAAAINSVSDLESLKAQAAQGRKLVVVFVTSSDPGCRDCSVMRKDYFKDREFMDWVGRYSVYGEIDVAARRDSKAKAALDAAVRATQAPCMPAMVLLSSNGRMLEYRPCQADVPSQVATLFHEIYLKEIGNVKFQNEAVVGIGAPPSVPGNGPAARTEPAWQPPNAVPVRYDSLKLKNISGTGQRRFALINDQTLLVGETARVRLGDKKVSVRCVEIREGQVVINVEGELKPRLLVLPRPSEQVSIAR